MKSKNSPDKEVLMDKDVNDAASNISTYTEKQFSNEVTQPGEEASSIQQKFMSRDNYKQENKPKQMNDGVKHQSTDDVEAADVRESGTGANNGESTLELEKAENMEEIDESEF